MSDKVTYFVAYGVSPEEMREKLSEDEAREINKKLENFIKSKGFNVERTSIIIGDRSDNIKEADYNVD